MPVVGCIYFLSCKDGGPGEDRTPDLRVANVNLIFLCVFAIVCKSLYNADLRHFPCCVGRSVFAGFCNFLRQICDKNATSQTTENPLFM